ncbi:COR domain-containing protein [Leptolyngbya sp. BC1307]|uniref:leucine-rich repeat domain-containing protein n=1 Tax=Leptolyngbya sp. BC1307 TaxID=2029589 RepID=UPI000EFA62C9|nr:COR domain-containing protein [Leptolyngbya sp. BC1307]
MSSSKTAEAERRIQQAFKTNGTSLNLSGLELHTVPKELGNLANLTNLYLSQNQLTAVPRELGNLANLSVLYLCQNQLTAVPRELGNLANLTVLSLWENQLTVVPRELGNLANLTVLSLWENQLTAVPRELGNLANLIWLYLSQNQLMALPKELGNLANLIQLYLDGNQLTAVPGELGNLANLVRLHLDRNQLTAVPKELGNLANLSVLHLDQNQLTAVPKELGNLANLSVLHLDQNRLTAVPKELGNLANLTELHLDQNRLTAVPRELGNLANLTELYLHQNLDLAYPSPEIIEQGNKAILTYLREQWKDGERQWISKLLVVGEGRAGKTSLLRALRGELFEAQQSSTHGIEIETLNLPHSVEPDITMNLNTWDFGGQEIYHATHKFFLTNRSLFLLVFNAGVGFEQGKLIYWLKTIHANAPDAPVILVATWIDERHADLPLSDLKQQFPQITGLCEASNKTGEGIKELQQAIINTAAELPLMGEIWPTTWLKFAKAIRQNEGKQATPQQFWAAMTKAKVSEDSQPVLTKWLHELGDILFFQDDDEVNDLIILKPQWVTQHISKVLTAEEVIKSNGIFTRQCMDRVWADLPPGLPDFFLRLMERFDLSYRTRESPDISLVVECLPFEPPAFQPLWQQKQQEANCKEISMKFQVSEILPGIPTWFIARQHRFTIDQGERRGLHWRTGVLFQDRDAKHLGLVRTLRDESTNADYLHLTVRGPVPHNFFDVLREGLELTLRRYPGLKVTRLLPCPDPENTNCIHEFDYANLTMRLERIPPRETIECPNCLEIISVTQLLFGLHYTTQDAVIAKIDRLQASNQGNFDALQDSVEQGFTELRELVQREVLREIRTVQKQIESPCPSVFVLRPDDRAIWQKDIGSQRINLQLYCEHPGCFHPVQEGGLYPIDNPKQWLQEMTPHLNRLFGILKYVTPVAGPWLGVSAPDYSELIKNDRAQTWGNLTRTTTPEGDVMWLCKDHIKEIYPTSS